MARRDLGNRASPVDRAHMKRPLLIGKAMLHVHSKGYLHNDLKANNVVLEKKDGRFNPVIIDFGKSLKVDSPRAKRKPVSKAEQKAYRERLPTHCLGNR